MKRAVTILVLVSVVTVSCTTMDPGHRPANGKRAYAAKAPKNKSAWK